MSLCAGLKRACYLARAIAGERVPLSEQSTCVSPLRRKVSGARLSRSAAIARRAELGTHTRRLTIDRHGAGVSLD